MLQNNKGTIVDLVVIVAVMLAFVVATVAGYHVYNKWKETRTDISETEQNIQEATEQTKSVFDYSIIFIIFGLGLFAIISAYFIDTHPAFFFISFVLLIIVIVLSAMVSNAYSEFSADAQVNETAAEFSKSNWVMGKLPLFSLIIGAIVLIVMYAKYQSIPR